MFSLNANRSSEFQTRPKMVKDEGKIGQIFLPVASVTIESIVNKTQEGGFHVC